MVLLSGRLMKMITDTDIMLLVQAGEVVHFGLLVERYRKRLLRFALSKVGYRDVAEDLVQEAFLAAFKARMSYRPTFAFSTWIWTILINLSRRYHRSVAVEESGQLEIARSAVSIESGNLLTVLLDQEKQEQLRDWLNSLPEPQADAVRLRFFAELSFDEIALTMNSSLSAAKVRVRKGLERLAELARKADFTAE